MTHYPKINFRQFHFCQILESYEKQSFPLDRFLRNYFHAHRSIGSHDRKEIQDRVYCYLHWQGLIDYLLPKPITWESRIEKLIRNFCPDDYAHNESIPLHNRLSFPKAYFDQLCKSFSLDEVKEICRISNEKAPITIRANLLKISRDKLFEKFAARFKVKKTKFSLEGIQFEQPINFFSQKEFIQGLFEVQDEGSQLIASFIDAKPKDQILDYCAASGGKTLALAPKLKKTGQLYLFDIRQSVELNAKKRLRRAGVENAQWVKKENLHLLKSKMDWVLADVPCSGSGTLRRNPDLKWRFNFSTLEALLEKQREIFKEALVFVKGGKKIVYSTCSLFKEENQDQVEFFLKNFPVKLYEKEHFWLPQSQGRDGFFCAIFEKNP